MKATRVPIALLAQQSLGFYILMLYSVVVLLALWSPRAHSSSPEPYLLLDALSF